MPESTVGKKPANPSPLGLLGLGMSLVLLNLHNAGLVKLSIVIVAMGVAAGGLLQIIAGITSYKVGNTFGGTAFTAFGAFWWSLVLVWWNPFGVAEGDAVSLAAYFFLWGLFTAFLFIASLTQDTMSKVVFLSLAVLFFLLAIGDYLHSEVITLIAGYEGIFCGFSAIYSAMARITNDEFGRILFPL
jgi:succinate-acetate transporter protein